jgi:hypothetical protein
MDSSENLFAADDLGVSAAAAMTEIRIVLSSLTPVERAAYWNAVKLLYRAPLESPMGLKEARPIQYGVAQGLETLFPPVW